MVPPDEIRREGGREQAMRRPAITEAELERRRGRPWTLRVVKAFDIAPRMRRVQFTGEGLEEFNPKPAQEIVLQIPQEGGDVARRHYTIRRYDAGSHLLDVDFVLHGHHTPGVDWCLAAKPGDAIDIRGPRGRIALDPDASWHLFLGDETCIPAIFALAEALPEKARADAFIEIGTSDDKLPVAAQADFRLSWLSREGRDPGPNDLVMHALASFVFPPGKGRAIVIGETSNVRNQRHALLERGLERSQIYAEGYWRPGRVGGHDHVED